MASEIQQACKRCSMTLFKDSHIHGVGTGRLDGKDCINVYVVDEDSSKVPEEAGGYWVNKVPMSRPFSISPTTIQHSPSDDLRVEEVRPVPGGISIGTLSGVTGTYTCRVYDRTTRQARLLSNAHVIADSGSSRLGSWIIQPGPFDGGTRRDVVALLDSYVKIYQKKEGMNQVDAALGDPLMASMLSDEVLGIGMVEAYEEPVEGMEVVKSGSNSLAKGKIFDTNVTVKVGGYPWGWSAFEDQIIIVPAISDFKDSGALVTNAKTGKAVGQIFAGNPIFSIASRFSKICELLNVSLTRPPHRD